MSNVKQSVDLSDSLLSVDQSYWSMCRYGSPVGFLAYTNSTRLCRFQKCKKASSSRHFCKADLSVPVASAIASFWAMLETPSGSGALHTLKDFAVPASFSSARRYSLHHKVQSPVPYGRKEAKERAP